MSSPQIKAIRGCGSVSVQGHGITANCGQPYWGDDVWYYCETCLRKYIDELEKKLGEQNG